MAGYWLGIDFVSVQKMEKKNEANIQPSWLNKLGQ